MSYIGYHCCDGGSGTSTVAAKLVIEERNANFIAEKFKYYSVDTTANVVNVTLPTVIQNGEWIGFFDPGGKFATNNLVIKYATNTIKGDNEDLIVNLDFISFKLVYNNGNWNVFDMAFDLTVNQLLKALTYVEENATVIENLSLTNAQLDTIVTYVENNAVTISNLVLTASQLLTILAYIKTNYNYTVEEKAISFTAVKNTYYLVDTSTAGISVTLPTAPAIGDWIIISDKNKTFGMVNKAVTIIYASPRNIAGNAGDLSVNVKNAKLKLVYCANNWDVIPFY